MKKYLFSLSVAMMAVCSGATAQQLSGNQIIKTMDGFQFTFRPTGMAEWSGIWAMDLKAKKSNISSMPKGGNATYQTVIKGDQLCNVDGVPSLHASHGLAGCFSVVQQGKSFYLYKGNRKMFGLRKKGVVN